uniref:Uncharacterized protein n=1 Tax=Panagrolaimus davidi TaxID=227884 RepID=A0A914QMA5_9BILA
MPFPNRQPSSCKSSKKRVTVVLEAGLSSPRVVPTRSSSVSVSDNESSGSESIATTITYSASVEIVPAVSSPKKLTAAKTSEFWDRNYQGRPPIWSKKTISSSAKTRSKSFGPSEYRRRYYPLPLYSRASSSSSIDYNRMDSGRFTSRSLAREERARRRRIKSLFHAGEENESNNSPGTSQIEDEEEEEVYRGINSDDDDEDDE